MVFVWEEAFSFLIADVIVLSLGFTLMAVQKVNWLPVFNQLLCD